MSTEAYLLTSKPDSFAGKYNVHEYDFSKINDVSICETIATETYYGLLASKIIIVGAIVSTLAINFFVFLGAISLFAPLGILSSGTSALALTKIFTTTFFLGPLVTCGMLVDTLFVIKNIQNVILEQQKMAEQRKVELLDIKKT